MCKFINLCCKGQQHYSWSELGFQTCIVSLFPSQPRKQMSDDYENVEWNVHATADAYTPLAESDDPLSVFSSTVNHKDFANQVRFDMTVINELLCSGRITCCWTALRSQSFASTNGHSTPQSPKAATVPYVNTNDSTESLDTSPSPPLPPPSSVNAQQQQPPLSSIEYTAKPMTIRISDPQKHTDSQGAYISYLITTTVQKLCDSRNKEENN